MGSSYFWSTDGVLEDEKEAFKWFQKSAAGGSPAGKYYLGLCYWHGYGIPQNKIRGEKLIKEAEVELTNRANAGDPISQYFLAEIEDFYIGDANKAVKYYEMAASQNVGEAMVAMGFYYEKKEGEKSQKAFEYFKRAMELGNPKGLFKMGYYYMRGWGVPESPEESIKLFRESAEKGYYNAQVKLGEYYEQGTPYIKQDIPEAIKWYKLAAEQGSYPANYRLALIYRDGYGVDRNYQKALKYMKAAADDNSDIEINQELEKLVNRGASFYAELPKRAPIGDFQLTEDDPFWDIYIGGNFAELPRETQKWFLQDFKNQKIREWGEERAYKVARHIVEMGFTEDQVKYSQGNNPFIYKTRTVNYPGGGKLRILEYPHCIFYFLHDKLIAKLSSNGVQIGDKRAIMTYRGDIVITEGNK